MPQIGPLEILVVGVLALIVFGPERLPEIGRSLGKGLNQMKRMASDVKADFDLGMEEEKAPAKPTEAEPEVLRANNAPASSPVTKSSVPRA
jgi:sec-independent protein translocase protein TatA